LRGDCRVSPPTFYNRSILKAILNICEKNPIEVNGKGGRGEEEGFFDLVDQGGRRRLKTWAGVFLILRKGGKIFLTACIRALFGVFEVLEDSTLKEGGGEI